MRIRVFDIVFLHPHIFPLLCEVQVFKKKVSQIISGSGIFRHCIFDLIFFTCLRLPHIYGMLSPPNRPVLGDSMSSQSPKNLTIFNFAQILHGNSHPRGKQLCKILDKSVVFFELRPLQKLKFDLENWA